MPELIDAVLDSLERLHNNPSHGNATHADEVSQRNTGKCQCDTTSRKLLKHRGFWVCETCSACIQSVQECNFSEMVQATKVQTAKDMNGDTSFPLVSLHPIVDDVQCFGCVVGNAIHSRDLVKLASSFSMLVANMKRNEESKGFEWEKLIIQFKEDALSFAESCIAQSKCHEKNGCISEIIQRGIVTLWGNIDDVVSKDYRINNHQFEDKGEAKNKIEVLKHVSNELKSILQSKSKQCLTVHKRLKALAAQLSTLSQRLSSFGSAAKRFVKFVSLGRKNMDLLSIEQQKKMSTNKATRVQTVGESLLHCIEQDCPGRGQRIADVLYDPKASCEQMCKMFGEIDKDVLDSFDVYMKARCRQSNANSKRFGSLCHCCNNISCHALMGIGYGTTTTEASTKHVYPFNPFTTTTTKSSLKATDKNNCEQLDRWIQYREWTRKPSNDIQSFVCVEMRLLGALKHFWKAQLPNMSFGALATWETIAKNTFWRTNFCAHRIKTVLTIITILLQKSEFYVRGAERDLSITSTAITLGFWNMHFQPSFDDTIDTFDAFCRVLMTEFSLFMKTHGNPATDAVVVLRRLQWKYLHQRNTPHIFDAQRVNSDILSVPCMPPSFPTRNVRQVDRVLGHAMQCNVACGTSFSLRRECTNLSFDELQYALQYNNSNLIGFANGHVPEYQSSDVCIISSSGNSSRIVRSIQIDCNLTPCNFGLTCSNLVERVKSATTRLKHVLPDCWKDVGIFASSGYSDERLAIGLVLPLNGTHYEAYPTGVAVDEGNEIVFRNIEDPRQQSFATKLGSAGSVVEGQLRKAMLLECHLSHIVHGTKRNEYLSIGMPCSLVNKQQFTQLAISESVKQVASFASAARLVGSIMTAPCVASILFFVDSLLTVVFDHYQCNCVVSDDEEFDYMEKNMEKNLHAFLDERVDCACTKSRLIFIYKDLWFNRHPRMSHASITSHATALCSGIPPLQKRRLTDSLLSNFVEAATKSCELLSFLLGDYWPTSIDFVSSESVNGLDLQVNVSVSFNRWKQFFAQFHDSCNVTPPDSYETLIYKLRAFEQSRAKLFSNKLKNDSCVDNSWTSTQMLFLWNKLSSLDYKVSYCITMNCQKMTDYALSDPRVQPQHPEDRTKCMTTICDLLQKEAESRWNAMAESDEVKSAISIEESLSLAVDHKATMPVGFMVFNTTGILRYILYHPEAAEMRFQNCYKRIYAPRSHTLNQTEIDTSKKMFAELKSIIINLGLMRMDYSLVGNFHRNRVVVEFLCHTAICHGTPREKRAGREIMQSGFCFLTCTFNLHSSIMLKSMLDTRRYDWDKVVGCGKQHTSYTTEEDVQYTACNAREAADESIDDLHSSMRQPMPAWVSTEEGYNTDLSMLSNLWTPCSEVDPHHPSYEPNGDQRECVVDESGDIVTGQEAFVCQLRARLKNKST